jgi:alcohol dehydrogenase class IV
VLEKILNGKIAGLFSEATMHMSTHITTNALEYTKAQGADSIVSIGGGSTIGLGKLSVSYWPAAYLYTDDVCGE